MKQTFLSTKLIIPTFIIASLYIVVLTLLMNAELVRDTLFGVFPIDYKINLLFALLQGMWTTMSGIGLMIFFITALLTGANLTLLGQRLTALRKLDNLHVVAGGNSLLAIVGSGCASCGLPLLSILGVSGSLAFLPLKGTELSYISVILLSISLYLMIKSENSRQACLVEAQQ